MINEVNLGSKKMSYFKFGSGSKTMVMIPGLSIKSVMESEAIVTNEYKLLTKDFTIYCFDRVDKIDSNYSINDMAVDTLDAIKKLGLKDIYLFGTSQGGMICISMLLLDESLFKKVVVASTTMKVDEKLNNFINELIDNAKDSKIEDLVIDFSKLIYPKYFFNKIEGFLKSLAKDITKEELNRFIIFSKSILNFNIIDKLEKINKDVLFVHDLKDELIDISNFYNLKEKYKNKTNFNYYTFDGFGHVLYDMENNFKEVLLNFYRG